MPDFAEEEAPSMPERGVRLCLRCGQLRNTHEVIEHRGKPVCKYCLSRSATELRAWVIAFWLILVVGLVAAVVASRLIKSERRRTQERHSLQLKVQQAAILRFPVAVKFLKAYPRAFFWRPPPELGEDYYAFVAVPSKNEAVRCKLPPFEEADRQIEFHGQPELARFPTVGGKPSISGASGEPIAEEELDRMLEDKAKEKRDSPQP